MFQCDGVILKGRVEIRLGGVAGVARLREETQVGQLQFSDHPGRSLDQRDIRPALQAGVDEHRAEEQRPGAQEKQGKARFPVRQPGPAFRYGRAFSNQES